MSCEDVLWLSIPALFVILIVGRFLYVFISKWKGKVRYVCAECGATMWSPKKVSGMGWGMALILLAVFIALVIIMFVANIVLIMWPALPLLLVFDAVIYYLTLKRNCCPKCGGKRCVVPLKSKRNAST